MGNAKKKPFESVEEIFREYIPDYVPPHLREDREGGEQPEKAFDADFASDLLKRFKDNIRS